MPPGLSILRRIAHFRECKTREDCPSDTDDAAEVPAADKGSELPPIGKAPEVALLAKGPSTRRSPNRFNLPASLRDPFNEDMLNQMAKKNLLFVISDVTQPHQPIVFASESFLAFTEFTEAEVLNHNCSFLQGPETNPATIQKIRDAIKSSTVVEEVILNYTKSGKKFWNMLSLMPIRPRGDQPITHYLGIQKDVTDSIAPKGLSFDSEGLSEVDIQSETQSFASESRVPFSLKPKPPNFGSPRTTRPAPPPSRPTPPRPNLAQLSSEFAQMRVIRESLAQQMATFAPLTVHVLEDGTVSSCSDACMSLFGYSPADVWGQSLTMLLDSTEDGDVWSWGREPRVVRGRHQDGTILHLIATPATVEKANGRFALPISFQNITTLKTIEEALQEKEHSLQALKMTMEHRKQFMNYIFHEVRQPFSVLMLGLQHIVATCEGLTGKLPPEAEAAREDIDDIASTTQEIIAAGESMHRILSDVLTLEKLQEGKMLIELSSNRVEDIVTTARKQTACLFSEKDITVDVTVDDELRGLHAAYDRCRLQQVMLNLLTNAHKFTRRGGHVRLSLECLQRPVDDAVEIEVRVEDDGVGISAAAQQQLFKPYVQLRAGELQEGGGTGLGLAITKGIVEAHGGTLGVKSAPDCGAQFWFRLRLAVVRQAFPPSPPNSPPSLRSPLIVRSPARFDSSPLPSAKGDYAADVLVVDDQALIRKYMQMAILRLSRTVAMAASGEEVVERYVAGERWRLILSDCTMGELSGPMMTRRLLALGSRTPVVGVTGNANAEDINDFLAAGARQVCTKPLRVDALAQCLAEHLGPSPGCRSP